MNTREMASEYRSAQWAEIIREQKSSGQSISAWCAANGVSRQRYFYWQRRLREAAVGALAERAKDQPDAPKGWALCSTTAEQSKSLTKSVTIEIGSFRVLAEAGFDPELLEKVCRILVSLC
jgi:putative transposase